MTRTKLFAVALAILLVGCLSPTAVQDVVFPAAQAAFGNMELELNAGLEMASDPEMDLHVLRFQKALSSNSSAMVALTIPDWLVVRQLVLDGIDAEVESGTISIGVGESLRTRLVTFESMLLTIVAGFPQAELIDG